jgi:hypothetical protein
MVFAERQTKLQTSCALYISTDASDADVAMVFKTNYAAAPVTTSEN